MQVEGSLDGTGNPASYLVLTVGSYSLIPTNTGNSFMMNFTTGNKKLIGKNVIWKLTSPPDYDITNTMTLVFDYWVAYSVLYTSITSLHSPIEPQTNTEAT